MPTMTASTGFSRETSVMRAEEPWASSTTSSAPAPTASAATTKLPVGLNAPSSSRVSRSLRPERPRSLRVETTVPRTCASSTPGLLLGDGFGPADGQHVLEHAVRARDDVDGHDLAHLGGRGGAGFGGRPDGRDVTADDGGDVAAADLLVVHQIHARRLHHGVGRLDH